MNTKQLKAAKDLQELGTPIDKIAIVLGVELEDLREALRGTPRPVAEPPKPPPAQQYVPGIGTVHGGLAVVLDVASRELVGMPGGNPRI